MVGCPPVLSLVMNPGLPEEQAFTISEGTVTIGRTKDNAVSCLHKSLSRKHAQLDYDGVTVTITDLQSKNGVYYDGRRVGRCQVAPGDKFRCGDITFLLADGDTRRSRPAPYDPTAQTLPSPLAIGPNAAQRQVTPTGQRVTDEDSRFKDKLFLLVRATELCVSRLSIDQLLEEVVTLAVQLIELDRIVLLLFDERAAELRPRVVKSFVQPAEQPYSKRVVASVVDRGSAAVFADVSRDRTLPGDPAADFDVRGAMCVPIGPGSGAIGAIYADSLSRRDCFRPDDVAFVRALANLVAVTLEGPALHGGAGGHPG